MRPTTPPFPSRQKGIAAVLTVLLVGMSLSAVVFNAMNKVGGAQEAAQTLHAVTQAQVKAWNGAEWVRQYLLGVGAAEAKKLQPGSTFTFGGSAASGVSAQVVSAVADASGSTLTVNVAASSGGAVSTVQLVYRVEGGAAGGGGTSGPDQVITLSKDLNLSGSVTVNGGKNAVFNVKGNVTLTGSVAGIETVNATGKVTAGGSQAIQTINANDDVSLSNGSYGTVNTLGNVTTSGGTTVVVINANKAVTFAGSSATTINAIGNVTISNGGSKVSNVNTQGSLLTKTSSPIASLLAQGNLTVDGWGGPIQGKVGGTASYNASNKDIKVSVVPGLKVPITPVSAVTVTQTKVDAYDYRSAANYAFDFDAQNRIVVTVNNVASIPNGTYFLGSTVLNGSTVYNYLCTAVDGSGRCTATPVAKICQGYSDQNSCFAGSSKDNWLLNGTTLAPGVVWFKGKLTAGNGIYYNSFIASGDIETSGSHSTTAVNYAGYAKICQNGTFSGLYPSNFCDLSAGKLTPSPAGNIAFLAGGYVNGVFSGGQIKLGASNAVYGSVLAGDTLTTSGSTTIHGYITVANQGSGTSNNWGNSTTINLSNLPSTFTPGDTSTTPSSGGATTVRVLWTRYL
ncbi:hypothetical protein [Crenobacter luteus]|uniref:hypothetical protein n=1 Tax=Crenobacter luteus TaxID=1452487 RepID=UPI0012E921E3|nr:hypothetical protein [Crenobacter luteus]